MPNLIYDLLERLDRLSDAYMSYDEFSYDEIPMVEAKCVVNDLESIINEFRELLEKEENE